MKTECCTVNTLGLQWVLAVQQHGFHYIMCQLIRAQRSCVIKGCSIYVCDIYIYIYIYY